MKPEVPALRRAPHHSPHMRTGNSYTTLVLGHFTARTGVTAQLKNLKEMPPGHFAKVTARFTQPL